MSELKPREWRFGVVEDDAGDVYFQREELEAFMADVPALLVRFGGSFGVIAKRQQVSPTEYETVEVIAKWQGQPATRAPKPEPEPEVEQEQEEADFDVNPAEREPEPVAASD